MKRRNLTERAWDFARKHFCPANHQIRCTACSRQAWLAGYRAAKRARGSRP